MPDVFVDNQPDKPEKPQVSPAPQEVMKKSLPFFASFCQHPKGVMFDNQAEEEHVILFLRQHIITNLPWISISGILFLLPLAVFFLADMFTELLFIIPLSYMLIITGFYYLIVLGYMFLSFVSWFYNVGIVTNKQIVDVDFHDIMYRSVAKSRLEDIVDVEFSQGGLLRSILNIGDVFVQTEGVKPNFEFQSTPKPDKVTDIILDLMGGGKNDV